ncbi:MAG: hypothetical protein ACM3SP_03280 [Chloroflexota bacterium]
MPWLVGIEEYAPLIGEEADEIIVAFGSGGRPGKRRGGRKSLQP